LSNISSVKAYTGLALLLFSGRRRWYDTTRQWW